MEDCPELFVFSQNFVFYRTPSLEQKQGLVEFKQFPNDISFLTKDCTSQNENTEDWNLFRFLIKKEGMPKWIQKKSFKIIGIIVARLITMVLSKIPKKNVMPGKICFQKLWKEEKV